MASAQLSFAALSARPCPPHAMLALAASAELFGADVTRAARSADDLARRMPRRVRRAQPSPERLVAVGTFVASTFAFTDGRRLEAVALEHVLADRRGEQLAVALACAEAARRAGIDLWPVAASDAGRHYLADPELEGPWLLDPERPFVLLDARELPGPLMWRCGHETAHALLGRIVDRAFGCGRIDLALRACELRLVLPVEHDALEHGRLELECLRANLN